MLPVLHSEVRVGADSEDTFGRLIMDGKARELEFEGDKARGWWSGANLERPVKARGSI